MRTLLPSRRGAHELGDLLLREVVGDPQQTGLLRPEALRELQQRLGHAARDVGEDQVREQVVGAAQPARDHPQQLLGDLRALGDPLAQGVAVHRVGPHVGHRGGRRRPRAGVEDRELAEHVRRTEDRQQVLPSVG
jgi:hypothetical protein